MAQRQTAKDRLERRSILEYLDRQIAKEDELPFGSTTVVTLKRIREWIRRWRPRTVKPGGRGR